MFGRQIRTRLLALTEMPHPVPANLQSSTPHFPSGILVWARFYNGSVKWQAGVITTHLSTNVYLVDVNKAIHKRHRDQLRERYSESGTQIKSRQEDISTFHFPPTDFPATPPLQERADHAPAEDNAEWLAVARKCPNHDRAQVRRYPTRNRKSPDYFAPYVRH